MNPSEPSFRSPPWVLTIGRWIGRLGIGRSVLLLVLGTVAGSLAGCAWLLASYPPHWLRSGLPITAVVSAGISAPVSFILCRLLADVSRSREALHRIAHVDALTGAFSRRHFMSAGPTIVAGTPLSSVILFDIDDFKQVNDRHGHPAGDVVLRAVSDACRLTLRSGDLFARYGGEEFIVLLPGTDSATAAHVAERVRQAIENLVMAAADGTVLTTSASFGVAQCPATDAVPGAASGRKAGATADRAGAEARLGRGCVAADKALYEAKRDGKNRVREARLATTPTMVSPGPAPDPAPGAPLTPPRIHPPAAATSHRQGDGLPEASRRHARGSDRNPGHTPPLTALAPGEFRSPAWVEALEAFVVSAGRLKATATSMVLSTAASVALTLVVMIVSGTPGLAVGVQICSTMAPIFSGLISWLLCSLVSDVAEARALLRRIAHYDGLTQAHSRPYFMTAAPDLLARSTASTVVVLLDVDNFKGINDRHGHGVGDDVLRAVSDACRATLRSGDLFARYGGEEFAVLLPGTSAESAGPIIERMRQAIEALALTTTDGEAIRVTASFGLTEQAQQASSMAVAALQQALAAADRALYRAKRSGKNRISCDLPGAAVPA